MALMGSVSVGEKAPSAKDDDGLPVFFEEPVARSGGDTLKPASYKQALRSPQAEQWRAAMEYDALTSRKTWRLVPRMQDASWWTPSGSTS